MSETTTLGVQQMLQQAFENMPAKPGSSRRLAMDAFAKLGLPGSRTEEYRFTPITRLLEKNFTPDDFSTSVASGITAAELQEHLISGYDANLVVFTNGLYNESLSKIISPSDQLTISPLTEEHPQLHQLAIPSEDAFTAWNAVAWQGGLLLEVPAGMTVEKPIFILHLSDAREANTVSHTRILGKVGEGSSLTITEKFESVGKNAIFYSTVEEFDVCEAATLNFHRIQHDSGKVIQTGTTKIHQHNKSRVNTFTLTLDGDLIRNNLNILVDGEGCESHFNGLYLLQNNTLADNHTVVDHLKPNSFSNELYKGIMDGNSKGVFNGKIYVRPHAQKTNAFQSNRNILLSDTATVNTKPQLEIWADDVKCSHGCTSGQLDEEAIFYLQSRGISKHTARAMVLYAFAGEVLATVQDPILKTYMDTLVSERLLKNL